MRALGVGRVLGFYVTMGAVGLAGMASPWRLWPALGVRPWALTVGAGVGAGVALVLLSRLAATHLTPMRHMAREFRGLVGSMGAREALAVAVLSGTSEEILFRGALQPALGLWLTALIFGLLHVGPSRRFIPWTVMAVLGGVVFGVLAIWTEHVLAPILAHITVNFLNLRFLAGGGLGADLRLSTRGLERAFDLQG